MESVASPPGEGDGSGTATLLRLLIVPPSATLATSLTVDVSVLTIGIETAIGKSIK